MVKTVTRNNPTYAYDTPRYSSAFVDILILRQGFAEVGKTQPFTTTTIGFLTRDPIGYKGSPWNLFEYVGGRPLVDKDPNGTAPAGHGHFCGPARRAICATNGPPGVPAGTPINPAPIDSLDAACAIHDCCLAGPKDVWKELCGKTPCNSSLCKAAAAVNCETDHPDNVELRWSCEQMKARINRFICDFPVLPWPFS